MSVAVCGTPVIGKGNHGRVCPAQVGEADAAGNRKNVVRMPVPLQMTACRNKGPNSGTRLELMYAVY